MDSYPFHLALAAILGASFAAISAYYMHHKTLSQLIEFTQSIDRKKNKKKRRYSSYQRLIEGSTGTGDGDSTDEEAEEELLEEDAAVLRAQNLPSSLPRLKLIHPGMA
jgi:AMP deaminase